MIIPTLSLSFCFDTTYRSLRNEFEEDDVSVTTVSTSSSSFCDCLEEDELDFFGIDIDGLVEDFAKLSIIEPLEDQQPSDTNNNVSPPVSPTTTTTTTNNNNKTLNVPVNADPLVESLIPPFQTLTVVDPEEEASKIVSYKEKMKLTISTVFDDDDDKEQASDVDQGNGTPVTPNDLPETPETESPKVFTFDEVDFRLPFRRFVVVRHMVKPATKCIRDKNHDNICGVKRKSIEVPDDNHDYEDDSRMRKRHRKNSSSDANECMNSNFMILGSTNHMNTTLWSRNDYRQQLLVSCCRIL
jgi:hypothetical protein